MQLNAAINSFPEDNTTRDWTYDLSSKNGSYRIVARGCAKNGKNESVEQETTARWGAENEGNTLTLTFELANKSNTLKLHKIIVLVNTTSLPESKGDQIAMFYERETPALGKGYSYSCFPNEKSLVLISKTGSKTAVGYLTIASGKVETFREGNDTMLSTEISCHVVNASGKSTQLHIPKIIYCSISFFGEMYGIMRGTIIFLYYICSNLLLFYYVAAESSGLPSADEHQATSSNETQNTHDLETSQEKHHEEPIPNNSAKEKQMCMNVSKFFNFSIFSDIYIFL